MCTARLYSSCIGMHIAQLVTQLMRRQQNNTVFLRRSVRLRALRSTLTSHFELADRSPRCTLASASCYTRDPMETAQSVGDDAHAGVNMAWVCVGARTAHRVKSFVSVGRRPGLSVGAQTRTRAQVTVGPGHLVRQTGAKTTKDKEKLRLKQKNRKDNAVKDFLNPCRAFWEEGSLRCQHVGEKGASL